MRITLLAAPAALCIAFSMGALRAEQPAHADAPAASAAQAQIARGDQLFQATCSICHGESYAGGPGVPGLTGASFAFGWKGKPAGELIQFIQTAMPPGQENSLSDAQAADVAAAVLAANKASLEAALHSADERIIAF